MKRYHIEGMHCQACASLITMELEEAGFEGFEVDVESHELALPEKLEKDLPNIKKVIDGLQGYSLTI